MDNIYDPPQSELEPGSLELGENIEHVITTTNWDVIRAVFYAHLKNKFIWALCILCGIFIHFVGFVGLWAMGFPFRETVNHSLSLLTWISGLFLVGFLFTVLSLLLNPKWRRGRIGNHTLTITKSHLVEETEYNKTQVAWAAVEKVKKGKSVFYITHSGSEVFVVPIRCFPNEKSWESFYNSILDKWEKQQNT